MTTSRWRHPADRDLPPSEPEEIADAWRAYERRIGEEADRAFTEGQAALAGGDLDRAVQLFARHRTLHDVVAREARRLAQQAHAAPGSGS